MKYPGYFYLLTCLFKFIQVQSDISATEKYVLQQEQDQNRRRPAGVGG